MTHITLATIISGLFFMVALAILLGILGTSTYIFHALNRRHRGYYHRTGSPDFLLGTGASALSAVRTVYYWTRWGLPENFPDDDRLRRLVKIVRLLCRGYLVLVLVAALVLSFLPKR